MINAQKRRRAVITASVAAALSLSASVVGAVASAQVQRSAGVPADPTITSITGTHTSITDPTITLTTTADPTSTEPTGTEPTGTEPTSTWPTITSDPTTTWPTTTWTTTTWTTTTWPTTTTTEPPPPCADPGPQLPSELPPDDEPAVGPSGGSATNDYLIDVGGQILDLYFQHRYPGFAGVVAEPWTGVLRLYWLASDPVPPEIAAIVASPGAPVDVITQDAPYSRNQLEPIGSSLINNAALSDQICGFLHTIKVLEEGTGLIAGVEPYDGSFDIATAEAILTSAADGVPVTIEVGPQSVPTGRLDDASPWYSGARITAGAGQCSTAFGVVNAGTRERHYMLTALHCFAVGTQVRNGDGTRILGPVALARPEHDSEVIRVDQAGTHTYFGGVGGIGAAERSEAVRRTANNVRGTTVACTSGASTGENCALDVVATNVQEIRRQLFITPGGRIIVRDQVVHWGMVDARSTMVRRNGQLAVAVGQGDSGGPVVTDSSRERRALGTMSSGTNPVSCGLFAAPRKLCFSTVRYADVNTLLQSYVAELR